MNSLLARPRYSTLSRPTILSSFVLLLLGVSILFSGPGVPFAACADATSGNRASEKEMKPFTEKLANADVTFDMLPISGGKFVMGSPDDEDGREDNESPQHTVRVDPFWMGRCEVTWDEYDVFTFQLDSQKRKLNKVDPTKREQLADAVTKPTKPYQDMTFDLGHEGFPAICMTQHAAKMYCRWLSAKTGHYYRLPTEAEWEYACRAGTTTAYHFGDDADQIGEYACFVDNSENESGDYGYQKVGRHKPNAWGLHDMHGNVAEWVLDAYEPAFYEKSTGEAALNPLCQPTNLYGRIVRGGSWDDDPEMLRSAARRLSEPNWKQQDPQLPQSVWYHTDALTVGFRIVRPLKEPTDEEKKRYASDEIQAEF
jgi:formylglycine-generating enzyme required for sulfatase activity